MISLSKFDLNDKTQWDTYLEIYKRYTLEVCSEDEELEEVMDFITSEDYHEQILNVSNRDHNKFHVCRILKDDIFIGFCDYICYVDEKGKCLIGNFFLHPEHRNKGYGTEVYSLIEKELIKL